MNSRPRRNNQLVGNAGLYYACYELSRRGWNAMPTSRNTRGVDIVIYSQLATRTHTIQVKSLTERDNVRLGRTLDNLIAEHVIICVGVFEENPKAFVATAYEVRSRARLGGGGLYWLAPGEYEAFRDRWDIIGTGYE